MSTPDNVKHPRLSKSSIEYDKKADKVNAKLIVLEEQLENLQVFPVPRSIFYNQLNSYEFSNSSRILVKKIQKLGKKSRKYRDKSIQKMQEETNEEDASDDISDPPSTSPVGRIRMKINPDSETEVYERLSFSPVVILQPENNPNDTFLVTLISSKTNDQHMPLQVGVTQEDSNRVAMGEDPVDEQIGALYKNQSTTIKVNERAGPPRIALFESNTEDQPLATGSNSLKEDAEINNGIRVKAKTSVKRKGDTKSSQGDHSIKKIFSNHK